MEIQSSGLTLKHTQERVVQPSTTSAIGPNRTTSSALTPEVESSQPAVETSLLSTLPPISRNEALQRILTEALTTLLAELDGIAEFSLPDIAEPFLKFISDSVGEPDKKRGEPNVGGTSRDHTIQPPYISSSLGSPSLATSSQVSSSEANSSSSLRPTVLNETRQSISNTASDSTHSGEESKKIREDSKNLLQRTSQTQVAPLPSVSSIITKEAVVASSQFSSENQTLNNGNSGKLSGVELYDSELLSGKSEPKTVQRKSASPEPMQATKSATTDSLLVDLQRVDALPKINISAISTLRDLIRAILSQPAGGANQLESGILKALTESISNESALHLLETLTQSNSPSLRIRGDELALLREQIRGSSIPDDSPKKMGENLFLGENGTRQNIQKSVAKNGEVTNPQLFNPTPIGENVQPSPISSTPIGSALKSLAGIQPSTSRVTFGVLSDPALLSALQGAALKRTYSDIPKLRKKVTLNRRPNERKREEGENLNDTSRESTGLSLLRAFLERRSELSGR